MTERREEFNVGGSPAVEFKISRGSVTISEGSADQIIVAISGRERAVEAYLFTQSGDRVVIAPEGRRVDRGARVDVDITAPPGCDVVGKVAAADINLKVDVGSLRLATASGDVRAQSVAGPVEIKTGSGDVSIKDTSGSVTVQAASGDISVTSASAGGSITAASGDLRIGTLGGRSRLRTAAGDVLVERFEGSNLEVKTLAGDVVVGFAPGLKLELDIQAMSGDVRHDFGGSTTDAVATASAKIKTLSGDVTLRRA